MEILRFVVLLIVFADPCSGVTDKNKKKIIINLFSKL